ncbi:NADP-dependent phosphogluconate dehydrogenase [Candidatus Liberibacter sp.]|uniref:NADP-dependent phosphogluconate dehydrogenase n=1 Tax=Candidatus Liberibacter sp. TaxID=34022 RepID=UPI0015F3DDD1|nr:NADP-dependent phosphogluconate dehydrogenase [Candidatus Liberibacter sp.]MBA5723942.1 NADP-dependent phosphogluconate dehydrogenase [Candidatus Liberibacter sp.]
MGKAEIGIIGLGAMGSNLALNMLEKGFHIAVYNRENELTDVFIDKASKFSERIIAAKTLQKLIEAILRPRRIFMMITDGKPIDLLIERLKPLLSAEDILMDGSNSDFRDTQKRSIQLTKIGITFVGIGVSGGTNGARHGPSLMVGGSVEAYHHVEKILTSISANYQNHPCCALLGPDGSGHFVKTIHNGIEYANMQMIADIYGILRDGFNKKSFEISRFFSTWNTGKLNSYLMNITAEILSAVDPITKDPIVDVISDIASQKGTGKRSVIESQKLSFPMTTTEAAVLIRYLSSHKDEREQMQLLFRGNGGILFKCSDSLIKDLENALYAAKIIAYVQGFLVIAQASEKYHWNLSIPIIAHIWRAGCIIRSQLLNDIAEILTENPHKSNILTIPKIAIKTKKSIQALRRVVVSCTKYGYPVPSLSAALSYFDSYSQGYGTANLIQAQRDFFGSHGFERKDNLPERHGSWGKSYIPLP